jgi:chorismate synthase
VVRWRSFRNGLERTIRARTEALFWRAAKTNRPAACAPRRRKAALLCNFPASVKLRCVGSSFGQLFRITTFGESHGGGVGVVIDGCPPRISLGEEDIQRELDRRRPGQSAIVSQRQEADRCEILSGIFEGKTLGTPIAVLVRNEDAQPEAYREMKDTFRPSHADFTYQAKYGVRNWQGGGRASARETIGRVAGGAIARKVLAHFFPELELVTYVTRVGQIAANVEPSTATREEVEATPVRCPDQAAARDMIRAIEEARAGGDSLGGVIECVMRGVPPGLGEPIFDKLEADLAKAMLSLPATKGFEIGSGFKAAAMKGSEHNDPFEIREGQVRTASNHSGGVQGGISNGENIVVRVAFKPTATIAREQKTVTAAREERTLSARGRHDPCVLPRAVPMVEAMAALVLCDHLLRQRAIADFKPQIPDSDSLPRPI